MANIRCHTPNTVAFQAPTAAWPSTTPFYCPNTRSPSRCIAHAPNTRLNSSRFHGRPAVAKRLRTTTTTTTSASPSHFSMSQSTSDDGNTGSEGGGGGGGGGGAESENDVVQYFGGPSPGNATNKQSDSDKDSSSDSDSAIPDTEKTASPSSSPTPASTPPTSSASPPSSSTSPPTSASSSESSDTPAIPDAFPSTLGKIEDTSDFEELPLFPLQMVLTPGSSIPLHIFETRYRLLFNRLRDVSASEGVEAGRFGIVLSGERLALIGCIAQVTQFETLPDGRMLTNNLGRERFRIVRIVEEKPYIIAKVAPVQDEAPTSNTAPLVVDVWRTLHDVLRLSNRLYEKKLDFGHELKSVDPGEDGQQLALDEKGWPERERVERFSFAVSQILDMPLKEQQLMLQTTDTKQRLSKQLDMLTTARQYLAAQLTIKDAGLKGF